MHFLLLLLRYQAYQARPNRQANALHHRRHPAHYHHYHHDLLLVHPLAAPSHPPWIRRLLPHRCSMATPWDEEG